MAYVSDVFDASMALMDELDNTGFLRYLRYDGIQV